MPPRPVVKSRQNRPISAIYVGKAASPNLQDLTQSPHFASAYPSLIESPGLPDLPEPPRSPSPSSSAGSLKSGLPSPPATNSTGSGSTGDPATIRERPLSLHSNGSASTSSSSHYTSDTPMNRSVNGSDSRSSSRLGQRNEAPGTDAEYDDDYDQDNDHESNADGDDNTARFDRRNLVNNDNDNSSSENVIALQRARNLALRTRMALDKLSKLGSPSPGRSNTPARSNTPNTRTSPAHSQHSRLSQQPRLYLESQDTGRSGSETEREDSTSQHDTTSTSRSSHTHSSSSINHLHIHSNSSPAPISSRPSSSNRSTTPPPSQNSPYNRLRHPAPDSPQKARSATGSASISSSSHSNSSHSPSRRRRNRTSMASVSQIQLTDFEEEDEEPEIKAGAARGLRPDRTLNERDIITQGALAAVATSRKSPLENRRRSALPREFRSDLLDESPTSGRHTSAGTYVPRDARDQEQRRESWQRVEPVTPSRTAATGVGRSSTLRDTRRTGESTSRWSSDDFRAVPATVRDRRHAPATLSTENLNTQREGRRQSLRGGSAESALGFTPGGRLLGEGLRAAGLSPRGKLGEAGPSSANREVFRPHDIKQPDWSSHDPAIRKKTENNDHHPPRASTSMSNYQYLDREDIEAATARGRLSINPKGHRSTYSFTPQRDRDESVTRRTTEVGRRERDSLPPERAVSSLSHYTPQRSPAHTQTFGASATPAHLQERIAPSPFSTRRFTHTSTAPTATTSVSQSHSEHTRLMLESLAVFEGQLAKLPPPMGSSNSNSNSHTSGAGHHSQIDVARNAQGVVHAAERLVTMLKLSGSRAMEAQIAAEVDAESQRSQELGDIWARVAADYREGGRTADELVRVLTAMLLGVGRIIRDLNISAGSDFGSPAVSEQHLTDGSDMVSSPVGRSGGSGRDSRASRQSWDSGHRDRERDRDREEALRRLDGNRPESVLARASPATFQKLRDHSNREREAMETPPPSNLARKTTTGERTGMSGTFRRLFTPREQREQTMDRDAGRESRSNTSGGADRKGKMPALDSQETIHQRYEPSPTPASKIRIIDASPLERRRTITPLAIPKPLPVLPSESASRTSTNISTDSLSSVEKPNSTRNVIRRASNVRGDRPIFPSITSPSNPTTAITTHTVSNSPSTNHVAVFPLSRTASGASARTQVTFSKPNLPSVSATLSDIQQQHMEIERKRTISSTSSNAEPSRSAAPGSIMRAKSGSETERDIRSSRTLGVRRAPRASLDVRPEVDEQGMLTRGGNQVSATAHPADRSAATVLLHQTTSAKRERRRTVTEIWPRE